MKLPTIHRLLILSLVLAGTMLMCANAQQSTRLVEIDGNSWELTRQADHCTERVAAAVAHYQRAPIYHEAREVSGDRFLINSTENCWIELSIAGVDDVSLLFKVSQDQVVLDRRSLSWWGLKVFPYPIGPNGL